MILHVDDLSGFSHEQLQCLGAYYRHWCRCKRASLAELRKRAGCSSKPKQFRELLREYLACEEEFDTVFGQYIAEIEAHGAPLKTKGN